VVALFFTVALPGPGSVQRHVTRCRRSLANLLVLLVVQAVVGALLGAFAPPLAQGGSG
jgi:hypothetical protein